MYLRVQIPLFALAVVFFGFFALLEYVGRVTIFARCCVALNYYIYEFRCALKKVKYI